MMGKLGGIGKFGDYNESRYMRDYLIGNKIDKNELVREEELTTTKEIVNSFINILKLKELLKKYRIPIWYSTVVN